jgi:hypothetical protein
MVDSGQEMVDRGQGMTTFLGVRPDQSLLAADLGALPDVGPRPVPSGSTHRHDRLVAAGSAMTAGTLIGGAVIALYGGVQVLTSGGGAVDVLLAVIGILLLATHWGWVHVAEYVGLTIDQRQERADDERTQAWLSTLQPYPRFSVLTSVDDDASTRVQRVLLKPVLTAQHTFTFIRETEAERTFAADAPAQDIAAAVETMRRQARLDTDRLRGNWEAASNAYEAALFSAEDDQQRLAAQRAAATALSEHINASLLEPPLVE